MFRPPIVAISIEHWALSDNIIKRQATYLGRFHSFYRPRRPLRRVEVQLTLFLDLGTRRGWGFSVTPRQHSTPRKDPVPIVQEAGWAPGPVWTGAENLVPTGIRSTDVPARSQSYRLSYRAHSQRILCLWIANRYLIACSILSLLTCSGPLNGLEVVWWLVLDFISHLFDIS
jgi:hypothetical protein